MKPFIRTAYNYDADLVSQETGLHCEDISLAQQHMAQDADINGIVKKFGLTGQLPQNVGMPQYGDFTGVSTYHEALNAIKDADRAFMMFPAKIRERFENSTEKFVEFCSNPENQEEAIKLGLVPKNGLAGSQQPPVAGEPAVNGSTPSAAPVGT